MGLKRQHGKRHVLTVAAEIATIVGTAATLTAARGDMHFGVPQVGGTFAMVEPCSGCEVDRIIEIRANGGVPGHHYFVQVVSPAGGPVTQDDEAVVSSEGTISARAVLGSAAVGARLPYTIRLFATSTTSPGRQVPADAVFSIPVTVIRRGFPDGAR